MLGFRPRSLGIARIGAVLFALALAVPAAAAQETPQEKTVTFIKNLTGEWIGTCQQKTDGEDADNKYFHAKFEQTGSNTFAGKFTYYRFDPKTAEAVNIGETTMVSTIQADGTIKNDIIGKGKILINDQPKDQEHTVTEILTFADENTLTGKIDGKISVSGMPFGIGKNGKIRNAESTWTIRNGVMTLDQTLKAEFKVLVVSKSFTVEAKSVAERGTDVVSLMKRDLASKPAAETEPGT